MTLEPTVLINAFEVPEGEDEVFLAGWKRPRDFLNAQPGYLSTRLHRSLAPDAEFRIVNAALWKTAQAFRDPTSHADLTAAPVRYRFHASSYEVGREDER